MSEDHNHSMWHTWGDHNRSILWSIKQLRLPGSKQLYNWKKSDWVIVEQPKLRLFINKIWVFDDYKIFEFYIFSIIYYLRAALKLGKAIYLWIIFWLTAFDCNQEMQPPTTHVHSVCLAVGSGFKLNHINKTHYIFL